MFLVGRNNSWLRKHEKPLLLKSYHIEKHNTEVKWKKMHESG